MKFIKNSKHEINFQKLKSRLPFIRLENVIRVDGLPDEVRDKAQFLIGQLKGNSALISDVQDMKTLRESLNNLATKWMDNPAEATDADLESLSEGLSNKNSEIVSNTLEKYRKNRGKGYLLAAVLIAAASVIVELLIWKGKIPTPIDIAGLVTLSTNAAYIAVGVIAVVSLAAVAAYKYWSSNKAVVEDMRGLEQGSIVDEKKQGDANPILPKRLSLLSSQSGSDNKIAGKEREKVRFRRMDDGDGANLDDNIASLSDDGGRTGGILKHS